MSRPVSGRYHQHAPGVVVTLVPGTWAGKAAWTRTDSRLSAALSTAGFQVEPFRWSHSNCYWARTQAAKRLKERLHSQAKSNPGTRQWIVAHSHGGNIALHAVRLLREEYDDAPLVSTVTLATPFIHARGRAARSPWPILMLAIFGALAIGWVASALAAGPHWHNWPVFTFAALAAGGMLLCAAGAGMHRSFLRPDGLRKLKRIVTTDPMWGPALIHAVLHARFIDPAYQSRVLATIHSPQVKPEDVFVIRAAGDEASAALAVGQFLGWSTALVNRLLTHLRLWLVLILATQVSALAATYTHTAGLAFRVAIYAFIAPGLVAVSLAAVMLAAALPFGWDGPFLALFASCSAEAAPPGKATILHMEPFTGTENKGLAHSRLYRSEQAISTIVTLIRQPSPPVPPGLSC